MGLVHMFKIKHVLWALLHREALQRILKCFAELALQQPLLLVTFFIFMEKKIKALEEVIVTLQWKYS